MPTDEENAIAKDIEVTDVVPTEDSLQAQISAEEFSESYRAVLYFDATKPENQDPLQQRRYELRLQKLEAQEKKHRDFIHQGNLAEQCVDELSVQDKEQHLQNARTHIQKLDSFHRRYTELKEEILRMNAESERRAIDISNVPDQHWDETAIRELREKKEQYEESYKKLRDEPYNLRSRFSFHREGGNKEQEVQNLLDAFASAVARLQALHQTGKDLENTMHAGRLSVLRATVKLMQENRHVFRGREASDLLAKFSDYEKRSPTSWDEAEQKKVDKDLDEINYFLLRKRDGYLIHGWNKVRNKKNPSDLDAALWDLRSAWRECNYLESTLQYDKPSSIQTAYYQEVIDDYTSTLSSQWWNEDTEYTKKVQYGHGNVQRYFASFSGDATVAGTIAECIEMDREKNLHIDNLPYIERMRILEMMQGLHSQYGYLFSTEIEVSIARQLQERWGTDTEAIRALYDQWWQESGTDVPYLAKNAGNEKIETYNSSSKPVPAGLLREVGTIFGLPQLEEEYPNRLEASTDEILEQLYKDTMEGAKQDFEKTYGASSKMYEVLLVKTDVTPADLKKLLNLVTRVSFSNWQIIHVIQSWTNQVKAQMEADPNGLMALEAREVLSLPQYQPILKTVSYICSVDNLRTLSEVKSPLDANHHSLWLRYINAYPNIFISDPAVREREIRRLYEANEYGSLNRDFSFASMLLLEESQQARPNPQLILFLLPKVTEMFSEKLNKPSANILRIQEVAVATMKGQLENLGVGEKTRQMLADLLEVAPADAMRVIHAGSLPSGESARFMVELLPRLLPITGDPELRSFLCYVFMGTIEKRADGASPLTRWETEDAGLRSMYEKFVTLFLDTSIPEKIKTNFFSIFVEGGIIFTNESEIEEAFALLSSPTFTTDGSIDSELGKRLVEKKKKKDIIRTIVPLRVEQALQDPEIFTPPLTEEKWLNALQLYIAADLIDWNYNTLPPGTYEQAKEFFKSSEVKALCLQKIKEEYNIFLADPESTTLPLHFLQLLEQIYDAGGAGDLRYVGDLGLFIRQLLKVLEKDEDPERRDVIHGFATQLESRFLDSKWWDQENQSNFYSMSTDILEASPDLFCDISELFENLTNNEARYFVDECYPFYQAYIALVHENEFALDKTIEEAALGKLKKQAKTLKTEIDVLPVGSGERKAVIDQEKQKLLNLVKETFQSRLGLTKVPEEFTPEHIRSIQNLVRFIGSVNDRDENKQALLGFYLALVLDNKWAAFRAGQAINPAEYLGEPQVSIVQGILKKKEAEMPIPLDVVGVEAADIPEFRKTLEQETEGTLQSNVQTIDDRLGVIVRGVQELTDPDIYTDPYDKMLLSLYGQSDISSRVINGTIAKMIQGTLGKQVEFTDDEEEIQQNIENSLREETIPTTTETLKKLQGRKHLSAIVRIIERSGEAQKQIDELQSLLIPSEEIRSIFNRFGEDFSTESGVMPLSQDLNYLEDVLHKHAQDLSAEETQKLQTYLSQIREKVIELEKTYIEMKENLAKGLQSEALSTFQLLQERLHSIQQAAASGETSAAIHSVLTSDWNVIIENIRGCLGCLSKQVNNDTNLAFGEPNRFFLASFPEGQKRSVADQLIYYFPVTVEKESEKKEEMSFVVDTLYGLKSADMLLGHMTVLFKKLLSLRAKHPGNQSSLFITHAALSTAGTSEELFLQTLQEVFGSHAKVEQTEVTVHVPKSELSEPYLEIGGASARDITDRKVSGLRVVLT